VKRPKWSSSTQRVPLKLLEHLAAMSRHVESRGEVVEHVVDEPRGEIEEELPLERLEDPFDAHAVFEDALQHQVPDLVVVLGLGEDALGCVAKGGGAAAPGVILAVVDFQEGDGLVGDGAERFGSGSVSVGRVCRTPGRGLSWERSEPA